MNREHAVKVLAKCSGYDARRPDDLEIAAFTEALAHVDYDKALAAVAEHYQAETRRIMPADIIRLVSARPARVHVHKWLNDGTCYGGDGCTERVV
ncbi:hypothetical protein GCM10022287_22290 [Gryllotalpicola koreensis]|uniref:Uncharacterized protein n=1 Tax=Gryllotalpicola koreensis TaxID=993086 RepID=A0ABP8A1Y9_9MICO